MTKITESDIEQLTIVLLEKQGFQYLYGPDIALDGTYPERGDYEQALLTDRLQNAIRAINPTVPLDAQREALKEIQRIHSPELLTNNETLDRKSVV